MCNNFEQQIAWAAYCKAMQAEALRVPARQGPQDLPQVGDIKIGDMAPVLRRRGDEAELAPMRFGWPPPRPKAAPVFNFRSEGRRFTDSRRCVIPASAFFEFTGAKYPKTKHRFTLAGAPFFGIAGLWKPGEGNQPEAFTMLTTAPGPDVAPIHNRQVVVLRPEHWRTWLDLTVPESEILRPLAAGCLETTVVRPGVET